MRRHTNALPHPHSITAVLVLIDVVHHLILLASHIVASITTTAGFTLPVRKAEFEDSALHSNVVTSTIPSRNRTSKWAEE